MYVREIQAEFVVRFLYISMRFWDISIHRMHPNDRSRVHNMSYWHLLRSRVVFGCAMPRRNILSKFIDVHFMPRWNILPLRVIVRVIMFNSR